MADFRLDIVIRGSELSQDGVHVAAQKAMRALQWLLSYPGKSEVHLVIPPVDAGEEYLGEDLSISMSIQPAVAELSYPKLCGVHHHSNDAVCGLCVDHPGEHIDLTQKQSVRWEQDGSA